MTEPTEPKGGAPSGVLESITAQQLVKFTKRHKRNQTCKICGEDCSKIAMVELVYVFEPCDCEEAGYTHLVEQLYHRHCFKAERLPGSPKSLAPTG